MHPCLDGRVKLAVLRLFLRFDPAKSPSRELRCVLNSCATAGSDTIGARTSLRESARDCPSRSSALPLSGSSRTGPMMLLSPISRFECILGAPRPSSRKEGAFTEASVCFRSLWYLRRREYAINVMISSKKTVAPMVLPMITLELTWECGVSIGGSWSAGPGEKDVE